MPPMFVILWNSASILSLVVPNADPEMLRLAALYVKITSLGIPVRLQHFTFRTLRLTYMGAWALLLI